MERVFRRGSHQYERFDCFKLSGRMTVDDFGGDLMRGTIAGGGAAGRWLSFQHRPPTLFSSPVLYFSKPYCNSHKQRIFVLNFILCESKKNTCFLSVAFEFSVLGCFAFNWSF